MPYDKPKEGGPGDALHEEVGAGGCGASIDEVGVDVEDTQEPPEQCAFDAIDELHEEFGDGKISMMVDPVDGMPRPADHDDPVFAPSFTRENLVCLGDDRFYVELFNDETGAVSRAASYNLQGRLIARDRYDAEGVERERQRWPKARVIHRWGQALVQQDGGGSFVAVRPLRLRCVHYTRLLAVLDGYRRNQVGGKNRHDHCAARRSVGGAHMSASNQAFLACSLREPRDPESEKLLDDFDEQRMTQERTFLPMFGGSGDELPAADVAGGIFEGQPMED